MTSNKLLSRLLRMVGFKVTWFEMLEEYGLLHLGVKPHKTGCRCPHCGRRGTIVSRADLRLWDDVVVCGMRSIFFTHQPRFTAPRMAVFRSAFPGRTAIAGYLTGWNIWCFITARL